MAAPLRRLGWAALRAAAVVYLIAAAVSCVGIDALMFHPPRDGYTASLRGYVDIGTNGARVAACVRGPAKGPRALVYCHGNAEDITSSLDYLDMLALDGFTVAVVDYEGYGLSSGGHPTEAGCYRNVHRLYDWLVAERGFAPSNIVVLGFSIGTGPAVELAATRPVGGLVLEEPFLSAPRSVTRVRLLPVDPFPNIARIGKVSCPLLVIHGTADSIVPFAQGKALYEAARTPDKRFVPVAGADHVTFIDGLGVDAYHALIRAFVQSPAAAVHQKVVQP